MWTWTWTCLLITEEYGRAVQALLVQPGDLKITEKNDTGHLTRTMPPGDRIQEIGSQPTIEITKMPGVSPVPWSPKSKGDAQPDIVSFNAVTWLTEMLRPFWLSLGLRPWMRAKRPKNGELLCKSLTPSLTLLRRMLEHGWFLGDWESGSLIFWAVKLIFIVFTILLRWDVGIHIWENGWSIHVHLYPCFRTPKNDWLGFCGPLGQPGDHLQHPHQRFAESFELVHWALNACDGVWFCDAWGPTKACMLFFDYLYSCCSSISSIHLWLYGLIFLAASFPGKLCERSLFLIIIYIFFFFAVYIWVTAQFCKAHCFTLTN